MTAAKAKPRVEDKSTGAIRNKATNTNRNNMKTNSSKSKVKADKAYHYGEYIVKVHQLRCLSVMEKHVATLMISVANSDVGANGRCSKSAIWFAANVSDYRPSTQESDVGERTIQRAHRRLEDLGIFTVRARGKNKGPRRTTNVWSFQPSAVDALLDEQNGVVRDDEQDDQNEENEEFCDPEWVTPMTPTAVTHVTHNRHSCHPLPTPMSPSSGSSSGSLSGSSLSKRVSVAAAAPRAAVVDMQRPRSSLIAPPPTSGIVHVPGEEQEEDSDQHTHLVVDSRFGGDVDADVDMYNVDPLDELESYTVGREDSDPDPADLEGEVIGEAVEVTPTIKVVSAPVPERRPASSLAVGPVHNDWNTWDVAFDTALEKACSRNSRSNIRLAKTISFAMQDVQAWYTLEQYADMCATLSAGFPGSCNDWIRDAAETIAITLDAQTQGYMMITNRVCGLVRRRVQQNAARNP